MARRSDIPAFGHLQGIKVLCSAVSIAGPYAANMYAVNGADVIWMESPYGMDALRWSNNGWAIEAERKNMRCISLDVRKPAGAALFEKMIADVDIFIEASRGGQWTKWGYPDEKLWELNPKLVITHMSGFGQTGVKEYVERPAYDVVVQAYCGIMNLTGFPDRDPVKAERNPTDYFNALTAYGSSLAAYVGAQRTGRGESIDLAQYESALATQGDALAYWLNEKVQLPRRGSTHESISGSGTYHCADGKSVYALLMNEATLRRTCELIGMDYDRDFPPHTVTIKKADPKGAEFEERLTAYCASHDSDEVERVFRKLNLPCSRIMDYDMMEHDPHMIAREDFIEWEDIHGDKVKGRNFFPRFQNEPSRMWRPAPSIGLDSADICRDYGLSEEEIRRMYEDGVIFTRDLVRREM